MSATEPGPTFASLSRRNAALLTVAVGVAHAVLFLVSYWLVTSAPGARASDEELIAFYETGDRRRIILVGLYVMPFAGVAFLWFNVALRAAIRIGSSRETELIAGMQLASGLLYVAMFFAAAAAFSVMAVSTEFTHSAVDPAVARLFPQYGSTLLLVFAMRMAAIFVFTTSRLGRITRVLPRWFTHVGLAVGLVLLFSATLNRALMLVFPVWLVILCALLLARARRLPEDPAGRDGASAA